MLRIIRISLFVITPMISLVTSVAACSYDTTNSTMDMSVVHDLSVAHDLAVPRDLAQGTD